MHLIIIYILIHVPCILLLTSTIVIFFPKKKVEKGTKLLFVVEVVSFLLLASYCSSFVYHHGRL